MEAIMRPVKRSTFYKTQVFLILIIALIFAYFYIINKKPNVPVATPFGPSGPPAFSHMIFGEFGPDQLLKPMAVTTIGDKVFVSDTNNHRIQVFTKEGTPLLKFGERGRGKGQFLYPYGLAGDSKGNLLVADMYTGKISVFDQEGNFIEYFGERNGIDKYLKSPSDIKFFDGKFYVADVKQNRIYVFDENANMVLEVGKEFKELGSPNGVTVNKKNGEIYVVDTKNARVIAYDSTGKFMGSIETHKDTPDAPIFSNPRGIGMDSRGVLYVVNSMANTIHGFDQEANELFMMGGMGTESEKFILPNGLYVDEQDYIYITDTVNNRIAVYR